MNRTELKARAKQQIKGYIGMHFLIVLIIYAIILIITSALSRFTNQGALIVSLFISPPFSLSLYRVYLNIANYKKITAEDAFCGFDDYWAMFKLNILYGVFTLLWTLVLIIPGIIKSISYSMSFYILAENKGKSARECINESKEMTKGHKWELFVLALSFTGWVLLGALTLGIGFIWIIPYMQTTLTNAYISLKSTDEEKNYISEI